MTRVPQAPTWPRWAPWLLALLVLSGLGLALGLLPPPSNPDGQRQQALCRQSQDGCVRITQARLEPGGPLVDLPYAQRDQTLERQRFIVDVQVPDGGFGPMGGLGLCMARSPLVHSVRSEGQERLPDLARSRLRGFLRPLHVRLMDHAPAGRHSVVLEVDAPPGLAPGLGTLWMGDDARMAEVCADLATIVRDRTHNLTWVMGAAGVLGLLLWHRLRDAQALSFALTALAWVLHLWVVAAAPASLSPKLWSLLFMSTRVLFLVPMMLYALQVSGTPERRWRQGLVGGFAAAVLVLLALPARLYPLWLSVVGMAALLAALGVLGVLVYRLWRAPRLQTALALVAFGAVVLAHVSDGARWASGAGYDTRAWSYLVVPMICLVFGARLVEDVIRHAERSATDAQRLRREVEVQRLRIAADYEQLQQQREQLAVLQERRRIVRDMHDGLGAQLLSASARLKGAQPMAAEEVALLFDNALQELRSVLDVLSVEPAAHDDDDPVSTLLGTLRWRMEPALSSRGVALQWRCDALPPDFLSSDASRMHLLRLLQEAFTNVLKHSGARVLRFELRCDDGRVTLSLQDDGRGFEPGAVRGIGLDSMRARAAAIGAAMALSSATGQGTLLRLTWG